MSIVEVTSGSVDVFHPILDLQQKTRPARLTLSCIAWRGTVLRGLQVDEAVLAVAGDLERRGIGAQSLVLLESDDSGRTVITFLALAQRGAAILLVDDADRLQDPPLESLPGRTLTHRIALRPVPAGQARELTDLRPSFTAIERGTEHPGTGQHLDLRGWFAGERALGLFSSGTRTGHPSLVWKSGPELLENAKATAKALSYTEEDVMLPLLPLHGQYGISVVLVAVASGAGIACCRRTRISEALRTISRHSVTAVDATPLVYRHLLEEIGRRPAELVRLESVRVFGIGGEPLAQTLADTFRAVTGRPLLDGYGLTQLGNVAFSSMDGSAGLCPIDTYRLRVAAEDGRGLFGGELGHVLVARADGRELDGAAGGLWFDTGDLGRQVGRNVQVLGREGMINRNGELIPVTWVEEQLAEQGVQGFAVSVPSGVSHRFWLLVHDPLHRPLEYWRAKVEVALDSRLHPDVLQVIGHLPVEKSGKVSRFRLEELAAGLQGSRARGRRDPRTPLGRLRNAFLKHRNEVMGLIRVFADQQTAQHDFRAMMNVLDVAEGELGLHGLPPRVPVDVFMPRNALLESFAIYCVVPSLWARRVRLRPARGTEGVVRRLVEIAREAGDCQLDYDTSDQQTFVSRVAEEPSVVLFTGLRANAESVLGRLSGRHVFLYFGRGVNPVLIHPGADVERAAQEIVYSRLYNGGQDCLSPDLILVHHDLEEPLLAGLAHFAAEYVQANGGVLAPLLKDETVFNAFKYLISHAQEIVSGGGIDYAARSFTPAIVRVSGPEVGRPYEHFAPIFSVATFREQSEVEALLRSEYYLENGFGVALYGDSERFAHSLTDHYLISKDQSLAQAIPSFEPFGGRGVESGYVVHRGTRHLGPVNITQMAVRYAPGIDNP